MSDLVQQMSDLVQQLRQIVPIHKGRYGHECIEQAADEIERLRSLITEWADADDRVDDDFQFRDWDSLRYGDEDDLRSAISALRKAVGR